MEQNEPPVIRNHISKFIRRKLLISVLAAFMFLLFFQKQEVRAADVEKTLDELLVWGKENPMEEVEQDEPMEYTEEELILLATVIYAEAGICDVFEKYCVGNVVLNRLNDYEHHEFANLNSIRDVIYQENQFSCIGGEAWKRGPTEKELEIAQELLEGKRVLPDYVVWFSKKMQYGEEYHTSKWHVFSGWKQEVGGVYTPSTFFLKMLYFSLLFMKFKV